jgi:MtN3 and saliva related transmembrane protein
MEYIDMVGHLGSIISSVTFMPQVYRVWKTKHAGDLSMSMMTILFVSSLVWIVYGVVKNVLPVIICNSIICFLSLVLIYFKFRYDKK